VLAVFGYIFYTGMKRNIQTSRFVHYALVRIPKVGSFFLKIALMKLSWGLNLTTGTGMDIKKALTLSFQGAGFLPIADQLPTVLAALERGEGLAGAFDSADYLDREFLIAVETGEQSGNLPELMGRLSKRYDQESQLLLKVLSVVGGFAVYGVIALCIIFIIFRIFSFYLGILTDATKM
jgi:type IV pilus assembly protein PilC